MANASDEEHLKYAVQEERAVVSMDADFLDRHYAWLADNQTHHGIFKVSPDLEGEEGIGQIVKELLYYFEAIENGAGTLEDDVQQNVFFIR